MKRTTLFLIGLTCLAGAAHAGPPDRRPFQPPQGTRWEFRDQQSGAVLVIRPLGRVIRTTFFDPALGVTRSLVDLRDGSYTDDRGNGIRSDLFAAAADGLPVSKTGETFVETMRGGSVARFVQPYDLSAPASERPKLPENADPLLLSRARFLGALTPDLRAGSTTNFEIRVDGKVRSLASGDRVALAGWDLDCILLLAEAVHATEVAAKMCESALAPLCVIGIDYAAYAWANYSVRCTQQGKSDYDPFNDGVCVCDWWEWDCRVWCVPVYW
jgi:hypothetical protein